NYPNPFNSETEIEINLPYRSEVSIKIYNILGQEVSTIFEGIMPLGNNIVKWDGLLHSRVIAPSGIYFYRLIANDFITVRKMVLLK
ncbi:MAG: T9SS type A sorting domain-containing protein, partial [Candidatus Zixiibacteriota bacterium]